MAASRPCEECRRVKRCHAYQREAREVQEYKLSPTLHLCRPCARALGYRKETTS
jgi:hypothetical protein